jgi:hypothetical protein
MPDCSRSVPRLSFVRLARLSSCREYRGPCGKSSLRCNMDRLHAVRLGALFLILGAFFCALRSLDMGSAVLPFAQRGALTRGSHATGSRVPATLSSSSPGWRGRWLTSAPLRLCTTDAFDGRLRQVRAPSLCQVAFFCTLTVSARTR